MPDRRSVQKHARTRHRDPDRLPKVLGEQIIAGHLIANRSDSQGYDGSKHAAVIYDIATSVRDCFLTGDKDAIEVRLALQHIIGPKVAVQSFPCDGDKELYKASAELRLCPNTSRPRCSTSNSIIERSKRHAEEGARTLVAQSGLPRAWWPLAPRFVGHMANTQDIDGESALSKRHGHAFKGYWCLS